MKIVIAPDSYKESLTALEVATEIESGFKQIFPDAVYVKMPVADGGEGTVQAMIEATNGKRVKVEVMAPLGGTITAFYGLTGDGKTAVIEMAAASGLSLVPVEKRNPLRTTSYGTGQLIRSALDAGARNFIIGIGGSATNDGGAGMVQALGAKLLDDKGDEIPLNGEGVGRLAGIDMSAFDPRIKECAIAVACDVDNPLCGPRGASAIFGPQKGADPAMVQQLDGYLKNFGERIKRDLKVDVADVPGAGAAGGMGAALMGFMGGILRPGNEIVAEAVGLEAELKDADLVITGEGRIDGQTIFGKTPIGVAQLAKRHGKPVIGIAGCLREDAYVVYEKGLDAIFSIIYTACTVDEALCAGAANLRLAARNVAAAVKIGRNLV